MPVDRIREPRGCARDNVPVLSFGGETLYRERRRVFMILPPIGSPRAVRVLGVCEVPTNIKGSANFWQKRSARRDALMRTGPAGNRAACMPAKRLQIFHRIAGNPTIKLCAFEYQLKSAVLLSSEAFPANKRAGSPIGWNRHLVASGR